MTFYRFIFRAPGRSRSGPRRRADARATCLRQFAGAFGAAAGPRPPFRDVGARSRRPFLTCRPPGCPLIFALADAVVLRGRAARAPAPARAWGFLRSPPPGGKPSAPPTAHTAPIPGAGFIIQRILSRNFSAFSIEIFSIEFTRKPFFIFHRKSLFLRLI